MKTILVPTDLSKCADNATKYAIRYAERNKSHLIFFHSTFQLIPTRSSARLYIRTVEAERKNKEALLTAHIDKIYKSLSIERNAKNTSLVVKFNPDPVEDIMAMLKKKSIYLVIMGTKGASGIKEVLMGSNTAKVIAQAKVPVIAVPDKAEFRGMEKITYATDYHVSDIGVLKKLTELIKPFNPEIIILHAANEELTRDTEKDLLGKFKIEVSRKLRNVRFSYYVEFGKQLEKVLQEHIKDERPDMIAMSTQRRNLLERLFSKSTTQKMAYHSTIPLLAFHHKQGSVMFI